jgi:glycogen debranching enzyme
MRWLDATLQAILAANSLGYMANVLNRGRDTAWLLAQADQLERLVNDTLWDDDSSFYYDQYASGELNRVKHVGAYWALLSGVTPDDRIARFVAHLDDPDQFNRPHRVPSLSADHVAYNPAGGYWCGSVWAPTNYMVLKGLRATGFGALAHLIACNHLDNVVQVFEDTGTVWENYAPEAPAAGSPAKPDFVGWTGLPAIAVLFEEVFGLQSNVPAGVLEWDVRLLDEFGVEQYPFGARGLLDLHCAARESTLDRPEITVKTNRPLAVKLHWAGGEEEIHFSP